MAGSVTGREGSASRGPKGVGVVELEMRLTLRVEGPHRLLHVHVKLADLITRLGTVGHGFGHDAPLWGGIPRSSTWSSVVGNCGRWLCQGLSRRRIGNAGHKQYAVHIGYPHWGGWRL